MKALYRSNNPCMPRFNFQNRNISSIVTAKLEPPIQEEDDFWVCTRAAYLQFQQNLIQKCAKQRALMQGKSCHVHVIHFGLQRDTSTSNMLINLYSKCGIVDYSRKVFDEMRVRSVVSWNTMIGSYTQNGSGEEALKLFVRMLREGSEFSEFAISSVLCACATKILAFESKQLHAFAIKASMESNAFVGTALLDVYAKCHLVEDAFWVFKSMPEKSDVTWSSMMAGFVQNELYEEALSLFQRAHQTDIKTNMFIISSILSACAALAALIEGKQVHAIVHKTGFGTNEYVASSLIDVYAKCGSIKEAHFVFSDAEEKNVVLWNTMISGFARHARSLEAMILFEKMQQMLLHPNEVTYVSMLSACAHMGLAEKGRKYFEMMKKDHNLSPNVFHYACMVDILGKTGKINEAKDLIDKMPFEATASIWGSLLASCRVYQNVELAEIAAKKLFEIEPNNAGNHVLLSNIYAANGRWDDVAYARKLLKSSEAKKERGKSWIEIKDKVHSFMVGEIAHPRIAEIYSRLDELIEEMEGMGFKGHIEHDLHDVEDDYKWVLLKHHSEKLAFTFGLMCLPSYAPIRIMKNLRICGDCHEFMKVASSVTKRDIIVRDNNRFHHFREGYCSCGEFCWKNHRRPPSYACRIGFAILERDIVLVENFVKPVPIKANCTNERWKRFKGCLGALDGTYIPLRVAQKNKARYRNRKGDISTYVLADEGWLNKGNSGKSSRRAWTVYEEIALENALKDLLVMGWKANNGFKTRYQGLLEHAMIQAFPGTGKKYLGMIGQLGKMLSDFLTWFKIYLTTMEQTKSTIMKLEGSMFHMSIILLWMRLGDISKRIGLEHDASLSRKAVYEALGEVTSLDTEDMILVSHLIVNNTKNMDLFLSLPTDGKKNNGADDCGTKVSRQQYYWIKKGGFLSCW
ncbi:hypothetical protein BUALT_Bualt01G0120600 [Buddleja alternifolia]|uniref:DYW domain-containing protein n=1 Tax=Buddleja alternifolia TaxID=168488 RepID=A0AAV6Y7E0_9LAMI|nr:hypothetical protein BUALT_Bualt01G0120600 [Buddleja alternifolia]